MSIADFSDCPGAIGVQNLTQVSADLSISRKYVLTFAVTTCGGSSAASLAGAWIDYNKNNKFEITEALSQYTNEKNTIEIQFSVPSWASIGTTRMRVQVQAPEATYLDCCAIFPYGGTKDFTIKIKSAPPSSKNSAVVGSVSAILIILALVFVGVSYFFRKKCALYAQRLLHRNDSAPPPDYVIQVDNLPSQTISPLPMPWHTPPPPSAFPPPMAPTAPYDPSIPPHPWHVEEEKSVPIRTRSHAEIMDILNPGNEDRLAESEYSLDVQLAIKRIRAERAELDRKFQAFADKLTDKEWQLWYQLEPLIHRNQPTPEQQRQFVVLVQKLTDEDLAVLKQQYVNRQHAKFPLMDRIRIALDLI